MTEPYVFAEDAYTTLWCGDVTETLRRLPAESVHCVVTSPPYYGLRDYGTAKWSGGDSECDHLGEPFRTKATINANCGTGADVKNAEGREPFKSVCGKCGAVRVDHQIGLEPTPDEFIARMVDVFREVRRVLRSDGTAWVNMGDSYAGSGKGQPGKDGFQPAASEVKYPGLEADFHNVYHQSTDVVTRPRWPKWEGMKAKDLLGIPWMLAFALRADGWYLRQDIVWSKPNPMPESVTDRCTKAHEYLFLMAKSREYFYDADAIRETAASGTDLGLLRGRSFTDGERVAWHAPSIERRQSAGVDSRTAGSGGRNKRSVWEIATAPYAKAHFATFPPKLVEPCIKAGTSERGCCPECGAPWERVVERGNSEHHCQPGCGHQSLDFSDGWDGGRYGGFASTARPTGEWQLTCAHTADPVPCTVLDPFGGSGTTAAVAKHLGRRGVLVELNPKYCELAVERVGIGMPAKPIEIVSQTGETWKQPTLDLAA